MKVNELRIGNYVLIPHNKLNKEEGYFKATVAKIGDFGFVVTAEDYQPIPLTDEWFEKWGFYKDGEYWSRDLFDYKYCFKYRNWADNWAFYQEYTDSSNPKDDGVKYPISFDIKYVHHVQNIWFALLHEEISE